MMALSVVVEDTRAPLLSYGYELPRAFEELDRIAVRRNITPLSEFVLEDLELYEEAIDYADEDLAAELQARAARARSQPEWHDPAEGLKTVRALREELQLRPGHEGVLADLETVERLLDEAAARGRRFHFDVS